MSLLQDLQELAAQLLVKSGTEAIWQVPMMCPQAMGPHPKQPPRGPLLAMFPTLPIGRPLQGAGLAAPVQMGLSPTAPTMETCRSVLHHKLCTVLPKQSHDAADYS